MRKIVQILLSIMVPFIVISQPCPDSLYLTTQAQVDSFQILYPNCTEIEGNVTLYGNSITNLNGLDVLASIGGDLNIGTVFEGTSLISLLGLNNLVVIGGELSIISNPELVNLDHLYNLSSIGGNISIIGNGSLTNLEGLGSLNNIGGGLGIVSNDILTNCEVQSICDYLAAPNGIINIYYNATGCNSPPEIANSCGITLPCLPFGNYFFHYQNDIDDFAINYPNCSEIIGYVQIRGSNITNLSGLNGITSLEGTLSIYGNVNLTDLQGLDNLISIEGNLNLGIARGLPSGSYYCILNSLNDLTGLNNLDTVGGTVKIYCNPYLESLSGLDNLSYIGGNLAIGDTESGHGNLSLHTLTGLGALTAIDGSLDICNNYSLINLDGLGISLLINEDLSITCNNNLSSCAVQSICNFILAPNGEVLIYGNASGCNNQHEVEEECAAVSIEDIHLHLDCNVSPNPFTTSTTLSYTLDKPGNVQLTIYNLQSQIVYQMQEQQKKGEQKVPWNAEGLPAGMYYFRIQAGDKVGGGKIIKISDS